MKNYKTGTASNGQVLHYSVGAIIKRDEKYLLIDRKNPPFGFAGVGGHVDQGELHDAGAMKREVKEESGLDVVSCEQIGEEELLWNWCKSGCQAHYWKLYLCNVDGEVRQDAEEEKSIAWYTVDEVKKLELEPVWKYWFEKIGIIENK